MRNYALVLMVLSGIAIGCKGSGTARGDLTVSGTPTGEVDRQVRIILAFSRPMVPKDAIDKPVASPPVTLAPDIAREARWTDDKTLVVVPTTSVPISTKFVATVSGTTKALDGSTLGTAHSFEFVTERITGAVDILGAKQRAPREPIVGLTFNHEVAFDQIAQHCVFASGGAEVKVKPAPDSGPGPDKRFSITAANPLALDREWTITCKAGLRGTAGNVGIAQPIVDTFRTYGPLRFVSMKPTGDDIVPEEGMRLEIAFTNPLKPPYKLALSPSVKGFPERCGDLGDPAGLACATMLDPLTSYTLTIDKSQQDVFGQTLDKPETIAFRTTDARPTVSLESGYFVAELKRPVLPIWARNVGEISVTAVQVTPANFHELQPLLDWWESTPVDFSKTRLRPVTKKLALAGKKNVWGQHPVDPAQLFGGASKPGMYYLEIGSSDVKSGTLADGGRRKVLVNFTDIGVVSKLSGSRGLVWATQLSTGKPLPGATVSVRDARGKQTWAGTTDAEGVAVLPGTDKLGMRRGGDGGGEDEDEGGHELRVYVSRGSDWTMVNPTRSGGLSPWMFNVSVDWERSPTKLRGFMHTDRGLYRPGDKVHVKGIARVTRLGGPLEVPATNKKVAVEVTGPQGKFVTRTDAKLSPYGGFWLDIDLPGDARLGDYTVRAQLEHGTFTRTFSVEEFRAATFEVTGTAKTAQVIRRGDLKAAISANYFYGAPVRAGDVSVTVHSRPRRIAFPAFEGYQFLEERHSYYDDGDSQSLVTEDQLALDHGGNANLSISVGPNDVYGDADLLVRASVTSPSNEVINKTFTIPYYRAKTYYGIKSPGYFLDVKKPAKFQIVGVAPDGKAVAGPVQVTVTRRTYNCVWEDWGYRGSYHCKEETTTIAQKTLQLAAGTPGEIEFTPDTGGSYVVRVVNDKSKDETAAASVQLYAWGDGGGSWMSSDSLKFEIVSDKKEYKAGDTATLILQTDLAEATGLVTIERDGVIEKRLIEINDKSKHVSVPITASYAPNVYVSVALVQGRKGDGDRGKPRMRMGVVNLPVRPEDNRLTVTVDTDRKEYKPGELVTATVKVADAAGNPAAAEVSITAADEGILSLIAYATPDPVPTFYTPWGLGVTSSTQLEFIRDIPGPNVERPATGGDAAGSLRSRFVATAVWTPGAVTNAEGIAKVQFKAPDNLTAFRMMAVAADKGYRFGSADKRFTVAKPLQLHQALPRFANLGDTLQGGVVVHNETGKAGSATIKLVTDKHVTAGAAERTIQLAKDARVPVLFDLTAAELGTSALTFSVTMNGERDAVKLQLPVIHPSPVRSEAVAHGAVRDTTTVPVAMPASAVPGSVELVVSIDPDGLAGIEKGLDELVGYPYGCLEQTTSKVIPMLAARDLAESLGVEDLTGERLDTFVKAGLAKIGRHQSPYGGFALWPGGEPEAYYTAYALWGLYLAKQAGYTVDQERIADALEYLRNDAKHPDTSRPYYNEHGDLGSQAFAVYVRSMLGDKSATADATTLAGNAKLPVYGKTFVARTLAAKLGGKDPAVVKLVGELAALADKAGSGGTLIEDATGDLDWYMSSPTRTTAMVLAALVDIEPKHPAIKPLVRTMMKHRRQGRYYDTQENLYTLVSLTSYARTVAGAAPSVTVDLGGTNLMSGALAGKQRIRVARVPVTAPGTLTIAPRGEVHYSAELRYRQKPETLAEEAKGITVISEILDEARKSKTSFTVGDVVIVRVSAQLAKDGSHLIVSQPLPAGFEALNTRFATVGTAGVPQKQSWGVYREMKDDRVSFAAEYIWGGTQVYEFSMRATQVGTFARPPATAELMYEPATRGQTGFERIEVKAK
jgi:alpha-2-macroglobulin